jgi:hypothetical protein
MANNKKNKNKGGAKAKGGNKQVDTSSKAGGPLGLDSSKAGTVNLSVRFNIRNVGTTGDIIAEGSEVVGLAANVPSAAGLVFVMDLSPISWNGTRAQNMASMFQRYMVEQLVVTYVPTCSTATTGLVYMYYCRDPLDRPVGPVSSATNITKLMSNQGAVVGQAWRPLRMTYMGVKSDQDGYHTTPQLEGADLRLTNQGMVYAYASTTPISGNNPVAGGLFKIDYKIRFYTPSPVINLTGAGPTGWQYTDITIPAAPNNATFQVTSTSGVLPGGNGAVWEFLFDTSFSGSAGAAGTLWLTQYTPLFLRAVSNIVYIYDTLEGALADNSNTKLFAPAITNALSGFAWLKLIVQSGLTHTYE